jgi:BMFP domain-containing protein YqiC
MLGGMESPDSLAVGVLRQKGVIAIFAGSCKERASMPPENRLFEDFARVASGALGAASGIRSEIEAMVRQRVERLAGDLNLVSREEFEAVRDLAERARSEQEALAAELGAVKAEQVQRTAALELRIAALEAKLAEAERSAAAPRRTDPPPAGGK